MLFFPVFCVTFLLILSLFYAIFLTLFLVFCYILTSAIFEVFFIILSYYIYSSFLSFYKYVLIINNELFCSFFLFFVLYHRKGVDLVLTVFAIGSEWVLGLGFWMKSIRIGNILQAWNGFQAFNVFPNLNRFQSFTLTTNYLKRFQAFNIFPNLNRFHSFTLTHKTPSFPVKTKYIPFFSD